MRITFVMRKFGNVERNSHCDVLYITPIRVANLVLDCNGDFAIKALALRYATLEIIEWSSNFFFKKSIKKRDCALSVDIHTYIYIHILFGLQAFSGLCTAQCVGTSSCMRMRHRCLIVVKKRLIPPVIV